MATNFPSSLDNFTNPVSGNTLDSPSHSLQHSDANDAIEAIEAKLGVGNSPAGSATAGDVLTISAAGTSAWTTPTSPGLVHINTTSFGSTASQDITSVFSSTYAFYLVLMNLQGSTSDGGITLRMLSGTNTPETGSVYYFGSRIIPYSGASSDFQTNAGTSLNLGGLETTTNTYNSYAYTFFNPNVATQTQFTLNAHWVNNVGTGQALLGAGNVETTTQYTGLRLIMATGNFNGGVVRVYGYRSS